MTIVEAIERVKQAAGDLELEDSDLAGIVKLFGEAEKRRKEDVRLNRFDYVTEVKSQVQHIVDLAGAPRTFIRSILSLIEEIEGAPVDEPKSKRKKRDTKENANDGDRPTPVGEHPVAKA